MRQWHTHNASECSRYPVKSSICITVVLLAKHSVSIPVSLKTCFNFLDVFHHQRGLRSVRSELVLAQSQCVLSGHSFSAGADLLEWTSRVLPTAVDIPSPTELLPDCVCEKTFSRTWVDRLSTTLVCAYEVRNFTTSCSNFPTSRTQVRDVTALRFLLLKRQGPAWPQQCRRDVSWPASQWLDSCRCGTRQARTFAVVLHRFGQILWSLCLFPLNRQLSCRPHFLRCARSHSPRSASRRPSGSRDSSIAVSCSSSAMSVVSQGARHRFQELDTRWSRGLSVLSS